MIETDKYIDFSERLQIANSRDNIKIHKEIIQRLKMWRDLDAELSKLFLSGGIVKVEDLRKMFIRIRQKYFPLKKVTLEVECDEEDLAMFKFCFAKLNKSCVFNEIKYKLIIEDK